MSGFVDGQGWASQQLHSRQTCDETNSRGVTHHSAAKVSTRPRSQLHAAAHIVRISPVGEGEEKQNQNVAASTCNGLLMGDDAVGSRATWPPLLLRLHGGRSAGPNGLMQAICATKMRVKERVVRHDMPLQENVRCSLQPSSLSDTVILANAFMHRKGSCRSLATKLRRVLSYTYFSHASCALSARVHEEQIAWLEAETSHYCI